MGNKKGQELFIEWKDEIKNSGLQMHEKGRERTIGGSAPIFSLLAGRRQGGTEVIFWRDKKLQAREKKGTLDLRVS